MVFNLQLIYLTEKTCLNVVVSVVSPSEGAVGLPWSRDPPDPQTMASLARLEPAQSSCMGMLLYFELLVAGWLMDRKHSRLGLPNRYSMHLFSKPFRLGAMLKYESGILQ